MAVFRRMAVLILGLIVLVGLAGQGRAQERLVRLYAPPGLVETGLIKYAMPRFSLKTQVRVELVGEPGAADVVLGGEGRPLFEGAGAVWHMDVRSSGNAWATRLADWLTSDIGLRTITTFAPDGEPLFAPPSAPERTVVAVAPDGDAGLGHKVSQTKCARCHVVDEATRMTSIGSTPSFFVLRSLGNWQERFSAFYALNPHPAFTQVDGVTAAFPIDRPPPIFPISMTLEELEAVMAYVAALAPADLGAPLAVGSDF